MLSGLISAVPVALLGAMVYAFISAVIGYAIVSSFTDSSICLNLAAFGPPIAIATVFTTSPMGLLAVALTPFWVGLILQLGKEIFGSPLTQRGYRGKVPQWLHEIDPSPEFRAAVELLDEDQIREVAQVSANAEDFKRNVIRAAGMDGHEIPDEF